MKMGACLIDYTEGPSRTEGDLNIMTGVTIRKNMHVNM